MTGTGYTRMVVLFRNNSTLHVHGLRCHLRRWWEDLAWHYAHVLGRRLHEKKNVAIIRYDYKHFCKYGVFLFGSYSKLHICMKCKWAYCWIVMWCLSIIYTRKRLSCFYFSYFTIFVVASTSKSALENIPDRFIFNGVYVGFDQFSAKRGENRHRIHTK